MNKKYHNLGLSSFFSFFSSMICFNFEYPSDGLVKSIFISQHLAFTSPSTNSYSLTATAPNLYKALREYIFEDRE